MSGSNFSIPPANASRPSNLGRGAVGVTIAIAVALFIGTVVILYRGWLMNPLPSSTLLVKGNPKYAGIEVRVESLDPPVSLSAILAENNNYACRFHLHPGSYMIEIWWGKARIQNGSPFRVTANAMYEAKLADDPTTAPLFGILLPALRSASTMFW